MNKLTTQNLEKEILSIIIFVNNIIYSSRFNNVANFKELLKWKH